MNPRKIKIMARLAVLEKERGKELQKVRESYRSDYIGIPMFKNTLRITAVFLILLCIWAVNNVNFILEVVIQRQLKLLAVGILTAYIVLLLIVLIITFLCTSLEYYRSYRAAEEYEYLLKQLAALEESADEEFD